MKEIPLKALESGMILAAPVEDTNGRLLLAAGESVQEGFIPALEKRGIRSVTIEEPSDREPDPDLTPGEILEQVQADDGPGLQAQLDLLFEPYAGQEPYDTLKPIIEAHIENGLHDWGEWSPEDKP